MTKPHESDHTCLVCGATMPTRDLIAASSVRAPVADLIALKLLAAAETKRRPSKREHDVADVLALLEEHPEVRSETLIARVRDVRSQLLSASLDDGASGRIDEK